MGLLGSVCECGLNGQNPERGIETGHAGWPKTPSPGLNGQNPERGIET